MRIAVLLDRVAQGAGPEHLDDLVQRDAVCGALQRLGHRPFPVTFSMDLGRIAEELRSLNPELVFNLVESVDGHGRLIHLAPALLDVLGMSYTGCPTQALFATCDKILAKKMLRASGIPTPPWVTRGTVPGRCALPAGPLIVKSVWEHASIGLNEESVLVARDASHLHEVLEDVRIRLGGDWFAETYIDGREFNVALLGGRQGPRVLPVAEILFDAFPPGLPKIVGYKAKWEKGTFEFNHTPRSYDHGRDEPLLDELRELAAACWELFDLKGYARVDFRVSSDGRPFVLEVNANPCLAPDAGLAAAAREEGMGFDDLVRCILEDALP